MKKFNHVIVKMCIRDRRAFRVFQVIVGKISYQAAGEGRQARDLRAPVLVQDLLDIGAGMIGLQGQVVGSEDAVLTGDFKVGIVAQRCV